ncbi:YHS domain-containing (seleno)protein [Litorilituus lipolyticus]|uniref:YHS domain-containing protein n=1 Tax=Litorilituus lipolyticus TaxID=2491017 RepID=A0A502KVG4_9GAMM|nr:YHS domain-containing (seleno)protein [Litorilituus lipolyticus]TPH15562.1 YHS domain-containing protein [Litorilituus lipolyticus]
MSITTTFTKTVSHLIAVLILSFSTFANAGVDTDTDHNSVILAGHDAVAYFTENKPVVGSAKFTTIYNDAIYRFSSAKNRDIFIENPERYAPQYGGFCAYGMTFGKKFKIDGKAFKIVNGKLFVNKDLSVYEAWVKDIPTHINQADEQWPTVKNIAASAL